MKPYMLLLALLISVSTSAEKLEVMKWKNQWQFDAMTDAVTCSVFSDEIAIRGKYGFERVYIGVQDSGLVTLHTRKGTFDSRYVSKFGIRAGEEEPVYGPKFISTNMVQFSEPKSKQIINGLLRNNYFTLQVTFFPENRLANVQRHVGLDFTAFQPAITSKSYCTLIKNHAGWAGIALGDQNPDEAYLDFIKNNSKFNNPGTMVWSIHPKKAISESKLKVFDVIIAINGAPVDTQTTIELLNNMGAGDEVIFHVLRGNKFRDVKFKRK